MNQAAPEPAATPTKLSATFSGEVYRIPFAVIVHHGANRLPTLQIERVPAGQPMTIEQTEGFIALLCDALGYAEEQIPAEFLP